MGTAHPYSLLGNNGAKAAVLTTAKPTFTIADAEGTPDNAVAAVTNSSPYGFSNAAEAITMLYKIQNLVARVNDLEARLQTLGFLT